MLHTALNDTLQLDLAEAKQESAPLRMPDGFPSATAFIRQAQLWTTLWKGFDAKIECVIDADHNHFTVINGLRDSGSDITKAFVG